MKSVVSYTSKAKKVFELPLFVLAAFWTRLFTLLEPDLRKISKGIHKTNIWSTDCHLLSSSRATRFLEPTNKTKCRTSSHRAVFDRNRKLVWPPKQTSAFGKSTMKKPIIAFDPFPILTQKQTRNLEILIALFECEDVFPDLVLSSQKKKLTYIVLNLLLQNEIKNHMAIIQTVVLASKCATLFDDSELEQVINLLASQSLALIFSNWATNRFKPQNT